MTEAGRMLKVGRLPPGDGGAGSARSFAREVAASYLDREDGDAEAALLQAVADGIAALASASRGFLRLGPPPGRPTGLVAKPGTDAAELDACGGHTKATC